MCALPLIAAVSLVFSSASLVSSPEQVSEPWSVASHTAVTSRDIGFQSDGADLSGTLLYPAEHGRARPSSPCMALSPVMGKAHAVERRRAPPAGRGVETRISYR